MKRCVGIDPGITGAVAIINTDGSVEIRDAPLLPGDKKRINPVTLWGIVRSLGDGETVAGIEQQIAIPHQSSVSTATTFTGYGLYIGLLVAAEIPYDVVTPSGWKAQILAGTDKSKDAAIAKAIQLFPQCADTMITLKKHHGRAEALLIAECVRRSHGY